MDLETFCVALHDLALGQAKKAICILWLHDSKSPGVAMTPGMIAKIMRDSGVGNPNSTQLFDAMLATKLVLKSKGRNLVLKPTSRPEVKGWLSSIFKKANPTTNHELGFLPEAVWRGTKPYLEKIAEQVNGCFEFEFYDGAAVMCRKLVENLLIESFEHLGEQNKIKLPSGDYKMLKEIVNVAINGGLKLGRDSKTALPKIKELGDRSAHTPRYTAKKPDLTKIESGIRLVVEELIEIAELKK